MANRQPPVQQAPPAQKLRVCYSKTAQARFASHRDFARAFERALRRAGVPMAYSSGFTPHPRISYANAAPTGAASEAEYVDIGVAKECDLAALKDALNEVLPPGLAIVSVLIASGALADFCEASEWRIEIRDVDRDVLGHAIEAFLASETVEVSRLTKSGTRVFDAREPVVSLRLEGASNLRLVIRHRTPLVRPDDVLNGLKALSKDLVISVPPLLTRLEQGELLADGLVRSL